MQTVHSLYQSLTIAAQFPQWAGSDHSSHLSPVVEIADRHSICPLKYGTNTHFVVCGAISPSLPPSVEMYFVSHSQAGLLAVRDFVKPPIFSVVVLDVAFLQARSKCPFLSQALL